MKVDELRVLMVDRGPAGIVPTFEGRDLIATGRVVIPGGETLPGGPCAPSCSDGQAPTAVVGFVPPRVLSGRAWPGYYVEVEG